MVCYTVHCKCFPFWHLLVRYFILPKITVCSSVLSVLQPCVGSVAGMLSCSLGLLVLVGVFWFCFVCLCFMFVWFLICQEFLQICKRQDFVNVVLDLIRKTYIWCQLRLYSANVSIGRKASISFQTWKERQKSRNPSSTLSCLGLLEAHWCVTYCDVSHKQTFVVLSYSLP